MIFLRVKSEGLAHISYFIGTGGEALIVDPRRDVDIYLEFARRNCMRIKYVLETHRNEDLVIGSQELKARTGCSIYHGKNMPFKYGESIAEGQTLTIDKLLITAIETPGHTPESMTYVLYESGNDTPLMAFTGDAIFPGTTGRIDLWGAKEQAAGLLYDSIKTKIMPLGDQVILCPAHGAGSVCGAGIGDRDDSTLGYERLTNPDLRLSREEFIAKKCGEPLEMPYYFIKMGAYNLNGPPATGGPPFCGPMSVKDFKTAIGSGILIDARMPSSFSAHIPGSYNIWLDGLATFPGWLDDQPVYLLLERDGDAETAARYLYRLGFEDVLGYLCGGFQQWANAGYDMDLIGLLLPDAVAGMLSSDKVTVLDVRGTSEWLNGHIKEAMHIYVGELEHRLNEVPKGRPIACMCSTGLRASFAASILKRAGFKDVYNVLGGITAWKAKDYPLLYEGLLKK